MTLRWIVIITPNLPRHSERMQWVKNLLEQLLAI